MNSRKKTIKPSNSMDVLLLVATALVFALATLFASRCCLSAGPLTDVGLSNGSLPPEPGTSFHGT